MVEVVAILVAVAIGFPQLLISAAQLRLQFLERRDRMRERMVCEHQFVTAQGSPLTRYRRAIQARSVLLAELSARKAGRLPLEEAVALVALYARLDDAKFDRAAVRWLARLAAERPLTLVQMQAAAAALAALPDDEEWALRVLAELSR